MLKVTAALSVFLAVGLCLRCYDCDPTGRRRCLDPHRHNIKAATCEPPADGSEHRPQCFTLYFIPDHGSNPREGIYRGCVNKEHNLTTCASVRKLLHSVGGQVDYCSSCASSLCNTKNVYVN